MSKVFLALPMYDGRIEYDSLVAAGLLASQRHEVRLFPKAGSRLAFNCTSLWCDALNSGAFDLFAMLHSDVIPPAWWLDILTANLIDHDAAFVSALSPIKDESEAFSALYFLEDGRQEVLSKSQADNPALPPCFDASALSVAMNERVTFLMPNTGCMVCRLDRPWCDKVWFQDITVMSMRDGRRVPSGMSEDWFFTKAIADHGGKVMTTKALGIGHVGSKVYRS